MFLPTYSEHQSVAMGYCTLLGLKPTCRCYIFIAVRDQQLYERVQRMCFSASLSSLIIDGENQHPVRNAAESELRPCEEEASAAFLKYHNIC